MREGSNARGRAMQCRGVELNKPRLLWYAFGSCRRAVGALVRFLTPEHRRSLFQPSVCWRQPAFPLRLIGELCTAHARALRALATPLHDELLEVGGLLVRRERGLVPEDLVEEELRGFRSRTMDHKGMRTGFLASLRQEAGQDCSYGFFLSWVGLPELPLRQRLP